VTLLFSPRRSLQGPGASARTGHRQECCSCFPLPWAASTAHMLLINSSLLADPSEKYLPYTDHCSYFASNFLLSTMNLALRAFMMKKRHLLRWQTSTSLSPLRFCQACHFRSCLRCTFLAHFLQNFIRFLQGRDFFLAHLNSLLIRNMLHRTHWLQFFPVGLDLP